MITDQDRPVRSEGHGLTAPAAPLAIHDSRHPGWFFDRATRWRTIGLTRRLLTAGPFLELANFPAGLLGIPFGRFTPS